MTEADKEKVEAAAAASVGAGVGGAGGATVGVLELAVSTINVDPTIPAAATTLSFLLHNQTKRGMSVPPKHPARIE